MKSGRPFVWLWGVTVLLAGGGMTLPFSPSASFGTVVNAQTDELGQERSYTAADIENASRFD